MNPDMTELIDYSRQADMQSPRRLTNYHHTIIGCGGIGYWLAIMLAMYGCASFTLIDADKVEASNLPRLPVPLRWRDQFKVKVLKATLRLLRPGTYVQSLPTNITADTLRGVIGGVASSRRMIWDCTDDARIQKQVAEFAQEGQGIYFKLGYEGWHVAGYDADAIRNTWIPADYRPGYTTNQANVVSSVIAAALGIVFASHYNATEHSAREYNLDLREVLYGQRVES